MRLIPIPVGGGTGGGTVDVGTAPTQIPNNTIVDSTIDAKLEDLIGNDPNDLTTNQQVTQIINNNNTTVNELIETLNQQIVTINQQTTTVQQQVTNIVNNPELVRPFMEAICTESLESGMYIKAYRDGAITRCCRTDAVNGLLANGFVLEDYMVGATVKYYNTGENEHGNDLPAGKLYLSDTIKGRASSTPPAQKSGHWFQEIGESVGPTRHLFKPGLTIRLL